MSTVTAQSQSQFGAGAAARSAGRRRGLSVPAVLVGMSIALIPWVVLLGTLGEWSWVGLDVMELAGLAATGALLRRGDRRYALTASATFVLLVTDAWFDITTSHGPSLALAWVLALAIELPIAAFCARLALRADM
ncbi:hypothetical protein [Streptacidiphilus fuscans]|uniref:Uncharacterized protein n=1 Tax=Streptacidiphilus fuscans TaxID=2789292 RepID=A0A931FCE3_9ACTN|nr:hypothetical protein [Streptacidiphilus fuscans]MBF9068388.1 hypothetical protein [Streptacidiphilus fuscans]